MDLAVKRSSRRTPELLAAARDVRAAWMSVLIEDVCASGLAEVARGAVINRHAGDEWHVLNPGEATAVNWDACLLK